MVFTIFPRPGKSGAAAKVTPLDDARARKDEKLAGQSKDGTGSAAARRAGDTEIGGWSHEAMRIDVEEEGSLSPSLENAALMFAHGNATAATAALTHAVALP